MKFEDMKGMVEHLMQADYRSFVQAIISIEGHINDKKALDEIYREYFNSLQGEKKITEFMSFQKEEMRSENFGVSGFMLRDPKQATITKNEKQIDVISFSIAAENGRIYNCKAFDGYAHVLPELRRGDKVFVNGICELNKTDTKDFYNINIRECRLMERVRAIQDERTGYLIAQPQRVVFSKDNRQTEALRFTLMKKTDRENEFINCTVYQNKMALMEKFRKGDLIKVSGRIRENVGKDGRVFSNFTVENVEPASTVLKKDELKQSDIGQEEGEKARTQSLKNEKGHHKKTAFMEL